MLAFARSIVNTVRHPLLILDAKLRVFVANPAFYHTFASDAATTEGLDLFEIDDGRWDLPGVRAQLNKVIVDDASFEDMEVGYQCPHLGRRLMVLHAHRVVRDVDQLPMVLLGIEVQTERQQTNEELRRLTFELKHRDAGKTVELEVANRELQASNRELEAFCFAVSHDLRTPLRAIDGFSQALLVGYGELLDAQGLHYLRRVRAGTQRMGQLIDDLLTLSRVTRSEMTREVVDLSMIAAAVIAELREQEPARIVSFTSQAGLTAEGDPALIRVALGNLLGNAWKFTSKKAAASITFDRVDTAGRQAFVVCDNGAGFDMAFAGKLFGAFQRLHSDREFSGTGIGLATVQRIMRRHGGEVRAEGSVGHGASFTFTLGASEPGI